MSAFYDANIIERTTAVGGISCSCRCRSCHHPPIVGKIAMVASVDINTLKYLKLLAGLICIFEKKDGGCNIQFMAKHQATFNDSDLLWEHVRQKLKSILTLIVLLLTSFSTQSKRLVISETNQISSCYEIIPLSIISF